MSEFPNQDRRSKGPNRNKAPRKPPHARPAGGPLGPGRSGPGPRGPAPQRPAPRGSNPRAGAGPQSRPQRPAPATPPSPPPRKPPAAPSPKTTTDWSQAAEWYDQLVGETGSEYHREVVLPGAVRLLAAKPGDRVLDVACGQGVLCRLLAWRGVAATGVDAAEDLIKLARQRSEASPPPSASTATPPPSPSPSQKPPSPQRPPDFIIGDARNLGSFLGAATFDAAACVLAIQNMHPVKPVFDAVARVLKPMGRLVLVLMHPCFRGPKETCWGWDAQKSVQFRRVDRYLVPRKSPIVTNPGLSQQYTWDFHKPIEAYVKALRSAGLLIDALEEWPSHKTSTSGPRAPAENTARKEIPMFMAIRALKIPTITPTEGEEESSES